MCIRDRLRRDPLGADRRQRRVGRRPGGRRLPLGNGRLRLSALGPSRVVSLLTMSVEPVDPFAAIPTFPELTTERFILREITIADAAWYRAHLTWPETEHGQGMRGPKTVSYTHLRA